MSDLPRPRGKLAIELAPLPVDAQEEAPAPSSQAGLCALLIGVSSFGDGLPGLPGAMRDASALHLALGRGVLGMCELQLLVDPDRQTLQRGIQGFCDALERAPWATGLIYIATHGMYKDEAYHLCLRESLRRDGQIEQALPFATLRSWLAPCQERSLVMCLDSCRGWEGTAQGPSVAPQRREDIALLGHRWGLISAAAPGQFAWEFVDEEGSTHGVFARALLDQIEHIHDPMEPALTLSALHEGVRVRSEQILRQHPNIPSQHPVLFANYVQDICLGQRPWSMRWRQLQARFCQQLQLAPLYQQPPLSPWPGSCLIRPNDPADVSRRDLALWGIQTRWKGLARGDGEIRQIVVQEHPHLDDMVAATGFFLSHLGLALPPALVGLAVYAYCVRTMAFPLSHRLEQTLAGHWMALLSRHDLTSAEGIQALAVRWCELFGDFLRRVELGRSDSVGSIDSIDAVDVTDRRDFNDYPGSFDAVDSIGSLDGIHSIDSIDSIDDLHSVGSLSGLPGLHGLDPFGASGSSRWAPEREWLQEQREAFVRSLDDGRQWAEGLLGQAVEEAWSVLREPGGCLHPQEWWLEQLHLQHTTARRERALLLRHLAPDRWLLCVHPDAIERLRRVLTAVQDAEDACGQTHADEPLRHPDAGHGSRGEEERQWRWIEGLRLPTIVSPRTGSLCSPAAIMSACQASLG